MQTNNKEIWLLMLIQMNRWNKNVDTMRAAWAVSQDVVCRRSTDSPGIRDFNFLKGWRADWEGIFLSEDSSMSFQAPENGHADLFYVGRAWQAGGGLRSDCKTWKRNMLNVLIQPCQEIPWPTTSLGFRSSFH